MGKQPKSPLGIEIQRAPSGKRSSTVVRVFWILLIAALANGLIYLVATSTREPSTQPAVSFARPSVSTPAPFISAPEPSTPTDSATDSEPVTPLRATAARRTAAAPATQPAPATRTAAPAPDEVVVKKAVELTVRQDGKVKGFINLKPGQKARVITRDGDRLVIAWREATGVIATADTDPAPAQ